MDKRASWWQFGSKDEMVRNEQDEVVFGQIVLNIKQSPVPYVLLRSIEFLDAYGIQEVGLYRVPGTSTQVMNLKKHFDQGKDFNFIANYQDPHCIATLLKLFLREMPESLLDSMSDGFHLCFQSENKLPLLKELTKELPKMNYRCLSWLLNHLNRVSYFSELNKMTINNLALIFSPTVRIDIELLQFFIEHAEFLFSE